MAAAEATLPPNASLYFRNLPDKLPKDDLRQELYNLCLPYGSVLDIVAMKTGRMRGQAHVLFQNTSASTQALRALQGFEFYGKEIRIAYAKSKSDTLAKLDGTYKQPQSNEAADKADGPATTAQQSIFAGPPGGPPTAPGTAQTSLGAPPGLKPPPGTGISNAASPQDAATPASQGVKRSREDTPEEEDDEAPMEMEESDED